MREYRLKTLAAIVPAAIRSERVGTHTLGRAMNKGTSVKHNIKQVERFLANGGAEEAVLARGIFEALAQVGGLV